MNALIAVLTAAQVAGVVALLAVATSVAVREMKEGLK